MYRFYTVYMVIPQNLLLTAVQAARCGPGVAAAAPSGPGVGSVGFSGSVMG